VISSEIHGMAMRGGSVISYIRMGKFHSPLIRSGQGDILIALSESEVPLSLHILKKGSRQIYVNSPDNKQGAINAEKIAEALGSVVVTNLVLLGFACGHPEFPFEYGTVKDILKKMSPPSMQGLNIKAFTEGYNSVKR